MDGVDQSGIEVQCSRVLRHLMYLSDNYRDQEAAELFTEDARFSRGDFIITGRGEILAYMEQRPRDRVVRHVISAPFFEHVTADEARSVSYLSFYNSEARADGTPAELPKTILADIHDQFRRTPAGWRIASHSIHVLMA